MCTYFMNALERQFYTDLSCSCFELLCTLSHSPAEHSQQFLEAANATGFRPKAFVLPGDGFHQVDESFAWVVGTTQVRGHSKLMSADI